jgi:hypothetical protein
MKKPHFICKITPPGPFFTFKTPQTVSIMLNPPPLSPPVSAMRARIARLGGTLLFNLLAVVPSRLAAARGMAERAAG